MGPIKILQKYCGQDSLGYQTLIKHSRQVCDKALVIADSVPELNPDKQFISEAAMLHDIGVTQINRPQYGFYGSEDQYIRHGIIGREILEKEGYPRHALVCERHVGTGLDKQNIIKVNLPLPSRDMIPQTIEEKIVCVADKYFRKSQPEREQTFDEIISLLNEHSPRQADRFKKWAKELKII